MEEIKSLFQVPVIHKVVDLHYLIGISEIDFMSFDFSSKPNKAVSSTVSVKLEYRFFEKEMNVSISSCRLFDKREWEELGGDWKEQTIRRFNERIRKPIIKAWEEYRKYMQE